MKTRRAFWLVTVAALAGALATGAMGVWQLHRAAAKEALAAAISRQNSLQVLDNAALFATKNVADVIHRQALLEGSWLPALTVFLDNRQMNGVPGFFVVTPLRLSAGGPLLMVQRGWVQRDFSDRSHLPAVPTPSGVVTVAGRLAALPGKLYEPARLSGEQVQAAGPIRQNLDLAEVSRLAGVPVLDLSLLQTGDTADGLHRQWMAPSLGVEKHYGYAAQWFALCALIVGLYLWFQLIAPHVRSRAARPHA